MNHQDWTPVVLSKHKSPAKLVKNDKKEEKKEDDGFTAPPKKFSKMFGQQLSQLRQKQNLTRTQLAQKLNVKESLISSIETGNENYNPLILSKLKRVL